MMKDWVAIFSRVEDFSPLGRGIEEEGENRIEC